MSVRKLASGKQTFGGSLMEQNRQNYTDYLKGLIYEDFLRSIASVRAGSSSDAAFRQHEERVCRLRMKVAAVEARVTGLRLVGQAA
jgi:hypothetical protein